MRSELGAIGVSRSKDRAWWAAGRVQIWIMEELRGSRQTGKGRRYQGIVRIWRTGHEDAGMRESLEETKEDLTGFHLRRVAGCHRRTCT